MLEEIIIHPFYITHYFVHLYHIIHTALFSRMENSVCSRRQYLSPPTAATHLNMEEIELWKGG